jgi:hypothetical protein
VEWWGLGRRPSPKAVAIVSTILISLAWNVLSDWAPIAGLQDLAPWQEVAGELIEAGLWLADFGLVKAGLPGIRVGGACGPEA